MQKVDVAVIAYNEEKMINECLDAILKNPEVNNIYVVDDGSTDSTLALIKKRPDRIDGKVRLIGNPKNMGRGHARTTALDLCKTDIVAMVDADTVVNKDWLKIMLKGFEDKDKRGKPTDMVIGLLHFASKRPNIYTPYITRVMENVMSSSNASSAMVFKRSLLKENPYNASLKDGEDMDWICRLMEAETTFNTIGEYIGTHYCDMTVFDLMQRYYEYGRNRHWLHKQYPDVIKITNKDVDTSEYMICTMLEHIRQIMGNLGYKHSKIEEGGTYDGEQAGFIHSSK